MFRTFHNFLLLIRIFLTLARHNALFVGELRPYAPILAWVLGLFSRRGVSGRIGERLSHALIDLGPVFIKFGQLLSTRADLVGEVLALDLATLQDRLPPFSSETAKKIISHELGSGIEDLFEEFEEKPVAAASIAQVHFAVTTEGQNVAVKVLRPQIERAFTRDITLFYWLAEWSLRIFPGLKRLKLQESIRIFEETTIVEMNLRMEGAAAAELRENFKGDPTFKIPKVDWTRTARRVLTLERINGIKVDEVALIRAAKLDPGQILTKASSVFFNQIFRDGFFHADLHPGNLFVLKDGSIAAVDFGIMGRLNRATRVFLADMLLGFLTRDYKRVARVHFEAGYVPSDQSFERFAQAVRAIGEPLIDRPLNQISVGHLLRHLLVITEQFNMETQPQLLLLQKSILTAEGIGRTLNPHVNMWALAHPLIEKWIQENRGTEAQIIDEFKDISQTLKRIPKILKGIENKVSISASTEAEYRNSILHKNYVLSRWTIFILILFLSLFLLDIV